MFVGWHIGRHCTDDTGALCIVYSTLEVDGFDFH